MAPPSPQSAAGSAAAKLDESPAAEVRRGHMARFLELLTKGCGGPGEASSEGRSGASTPSACSDTCSPVCPATAVKQTVHAPAFNTRAFIPTRVNAKITDRYSMDAKEIGSGGFGKVFIAEDRAVEGRRVAIKKASAMRRSRREAFDKEAAAMKALDHPNICKLLETYDDGKSLFLVMELCDGGELFDLIVGGSQLGIREDICIDIVRQVAGALKYAHARGIAHRDLKPENVCLMSIGKDKYHVKVIDWGLAAFVGVDSGGRHLERMRSNVGSVAYAAPEVLEASSKAVPSSNQHRWLFGGRSASAGAAVGYSPACDMWSLGVLTFVALTGRFPFNGKNTQEQLRAISFIDKNLLSKALKGNSVNAKNFIWSLLRKNPADRPLVKHIVNDKWLKHNASVDTRDVLSQVHGSSGRKFPVSFFAALVARQLDHQSLRELPQVFLELDTDGNGELDIDEVRRGFTHIFGEGSQEVADVERMFRVLDLDGSGSLDYTEFCAAGLGNRIADEDSAMRAAFKAFDVDDNNNRVTRHEFELVLKRANMLKPRRRGRSGSSGCSVEDPIIMEEVFASFDADGDGTLDYEEWKAWVGHLVSTGSTPPAAASADAAGAAASPSTTGTAQVSPSVSTKASVPKSRCAASGGA